MSLSSTVSIFIRHLLRDSRDSATSSARSSHSNSSGRADLRSAPIDCPRVGIVTASSYSHLSCKSGIGGERGGTVQRSRVCGTSGIVYLLPSQMPCTTNPFSRYISNRIYLEGGGLGKYNISHTANKIYKIYKSRQ